MPILNPNSMLYWYPLVKGLDINIPRTTLIELTEKQVKLCWTVLDGKLINTDLVREQWDSLLEYIQNIIAASYTLPVFLRGDSTSGKHNYNDTCYLTDIKLIGNHLFNLIEDSVLSIDEVPHGFAIREFLQLDAPFKAFNGLPIARERRFFIKDGSIACCHSYWPEDSIRFFRATKPEIIGWKEHLLSINNYTPNSVALEASVCILSKVLSGYWSVDFAYTTNGQWYFIDAANGEDSYHWLGCPHRLNPV